MSWDGSTRGRPQKEEESKRGKYDLERGARRRESERPPSAAVSSTETSRHKAIARKRLTSPSVVITRPGPAATITSGSGIRDGVRSGGSLNGSCATELIENVKEQWCAESGCCEEAYETTATAGVARKRRQAWGKKQDSTGDKPGFVSGGIGTEDVRFPNEEATGACYSPNPATNSAKEGFSRISPGDLCCRGAADLNETRCQGSGEEKETLSKRGEQDQEEQVIARLGRRILAHTAGEERLRRFVETLRVMSGANVANGGQVSGKDLLQASRDVGVTGSLTTGDLREIGRMFGNRRGGRVPLRTLVANLLVPQQQQECVRGKQQAMVTDAAITQGQGQQISSSPRRAVVTASSEREERHRSEEWVDKILDDEAVRKPQGRGTTARAVNRAGAVVTRETGISSVRSVSRCSDKGETSSRASSSGRRRLYGDNFAGQGRATRSAASRGRQRLEVNENRVRTAARQDHSVANGKIGVHRDSRATCKRGKRDDSDDGDDNNNNTQRQDSSSVRIDENVNNTVTVARNNHHEEDPIVELARIIFNPTCSLEGLIHVLQASKVWFCNCGAHLLRAMPKLGLVGKALAHKL